MNALRAGRLTRARCPSRTYFISKITMYLCLIENCYFSKFKKKIKNKHEILGIKNV